MNYTTFDTIVNYIKHVVPKEKSCIPTAIANYSLSHLADLSTFVLGCLSMIKQVDDGYTTHLEATVASRPFQMVLTYLISASDLILLESCILLQ